MLKLCTVTQNLLNTLAGVSFENLNQAKQAQLTTSIQQVQEALTVFSVDAKTPREQAHLDYAEAKKLGVTQFDRWGAGIEHHPMSERLVRFLAEHDCQDYQNYFDWRIGGDGDKGESLMYQMDAFFEMLDKAQVENNSNQKD